VGGGRKQNKKGKGDETKEMKIRRAQRTIFWTERIIFGCSKNIY